MQTRLDAVCGDEGLGQGEPSMRPEHEFVVLAYGRSPYLDGCLRTLRAQSVASRITVSTSTPDPAIALLAETHGAALHINPIRDGIGPDWNFALDRAEGRYLTLAHQDDVYAPQFTARTLALFEAHPEGRLCFTGYDEVDDAGKPTHSRISRVKHALERGVLGSRTVVAGRRLRAFMAFGNPLPCSSVTFDRERLADFRFDERLASNLDWEAWMRLCERGDAFLRARERLVGRRRNPLTETSRLIQDGRRQREDREMFRRLWPAPIAYVLAQAYRLSYA